MPSAAKAARWTKLPSAQRSSRPSRPKTRRSPASRPRRRRPKRKSPGSGKIAADAKDAVIETFKANPENARKIFGSVPERTKLSSLAGTQGGDAGKYAAKSWDELDRAGLLAELKANHPDLYEKKYKEMAASLHICRG